MSKQKQSAGPGRWLNEHFADEFLTEAEKKGYRSRAIFKVGEIQ